MGPLLTLFSNPLPTPPFDSTSQKLFSSSFLGPATTQNLVEKFDGEICGGVFDGANASDDFPSKRSSKISFQTSPEVHHQLRRKLCQLHSGNRWCLHNKGVSDLHGTLFRALLRPCAPFADLRLRSLVLICAVLRAFVCFCVRPRLERPRLGTAELLLPRHRRCAQNISSWAFPPRRDVEYT